MGLPTKTLIGAAVVTFLICSLGSTPSGGKAST